MYKSDLISSSLFSPPFFCSFYKKGSQSRFPSPPSLLRLPSWHLCASSCFFLLEITFCFWWGYKHSLIYLGQHQILGVTCVPGILILKVRFGQSLLFIIRLVICYIVYYFRDLFWNCSLLICTILSFSTYTIASRGNVTRHHSDSANTCFFDLIFCWEEVR